MDVLGVRNFHLSAQSVQLILSLLFNVRGVSELIRTMFKMTNLNSM